MKDLQNANYFNNGFVQEQDISYYVKKTSHSVLANHAKTFQIFSRTYKQSSSTFKDFPGQQKNPGLFQDVATRGEVLEDTF